MKVLHVVWSAKYGGAETMLVDILNYQVTQHNISLLIINDAIDNSLLDCFDKRIEIIRINRPLRSRNVFYVLKLNYKLLFGNAHIIHFHQDDIIRYTPVYRLKNNFCLTVHSVEMDVISLHKYNYIFAVSTAVQEKLKNDYNQDSLLVINGIKTDEIAKKETSYSWVKPFKIVQISRLEHLHKGQHILLQAIYQLINKYHFKDIHLDIIGAGSSELYLKEMTKDLKLENYVTFTGVQSKKYLQKNICHYDLLIQPSMWEGFGLTAIEAMAALVPVLVSNVDGLKITAQEGKAAFTFEPGDVEACANAIFQIIHLSPEEKEEKCKQAYNYVIENFDIARTAENYLNFYEKIMNKTIHS